MNASEVLIPKEVADRLRVSEAFVRRECKAGAIPGAFALGSKMRPVWRIRRLAFEKWLSTGLEREESIPAR